MNKNLYRIVFNQARGLLMAVAEIASARGKGSSAANSLGVARGGAIQIRFAKLKLLPLATQLACGASFLLMPLAHAQIIPDASAPGNQRPTVLSAPNGVPLVNIQTPSAAGVSRNTYSQFDVQQQGAILNNANTTTQTQLGGYVVGNPNLVGGTARVILNEVNSSNPSQLRGYIEVGGDRAQVIVANPSGITCDGCGFINANRATLTTGTPILNGGSLDGYLVQRGAVTIQGAGLDASQAGFTDIIARAVQVNAGIFAQELKITTGANQVSADHSQITPVAGTGNAPAFAIDVAQLGGMYAGKITLIGNEAGIGVRNAGQIGASAGEVVVTVDGRIENSGTITSTNQIRATTQNQLSNSGTIAAQSDVGLNAASIDNSGGIIGSVGGSVALSSNGLLTNDTGHIEAAQRIDSTSSGLDNRAGVISGQNVVLNSNHQSLDNTLGTIAASGTLDMQSGALNNDQGLIQASGAANIDTHGQSLANTHSGSSGGIFSQDTLTLNTGNLTNSSGVIGALGNLSANSGAIDNTQGGEISSAQAITVTGTSLDNQGGQIQAQGNLTLGLGNGTLDNTSSLLRSGSSLAISAGSVINANTQGANQGIEGQAVQVSANTIDNYSGSILADNAVALAGSGSIDNSQGLISGNDVSLNDIQTAKTLAITNTQGTLIAGNKLTIDSNSLSGDGQVLSLGDIDAKLDADFTNTGNVQANSNTSVETKGTLDNNGTFAAGDTLSLKASTLANQTNGTVSAPHVQLTATAPNTLINRGLIDGADTAIDTITLDNLGTGRIYGDHVSIGATTLNNEAENGASPVIAARDRLDIGATNINNREGALLFSLGDMAIGGSLDSNRHATSQADTLNNNSASIEAQGNLDLAAKTINNTNEHFSTQVAQVSSEAITELQLSGSPNRYTEPTPAYENNGATDDLMQAITPEGSSDNYIRYSYNRVTTETQIATTAPGQILAGGALNISADTLLNDKSIIQAGGALAGNIGTLTNTEATGDRTIADNGSATNFYRIHQKGRDDQGADTSAYTPAPVIQAISVGPAVYQGHTAPTGSGTKISPLAIVSVPQTPGAANAAKIDVRSIGVNTSLPGNSLFNTNPGAPNGYLIETDPRFTNLRQFLSSDYLLQQLSLDPGASQKRLGDGFYEQRLVREQIAQLTGRRFLDGYAADEAQYRALLNNGATSASALNLRLGVALSAEQMAALTSDIVWLVEKTITLADGSNVQALVPQVYVRVKDGDLNGSGALIAGQSLNLNVSGDIVNSGTLAGRSIASLTADNIKNLGGRISATDTTVAARTDLANLGGVIDAANSLSLSAGRDINIASTTRDTTSSQGKRTNIERVAGLYITGSGGTLVASAGRDLNLDAATIANGLIESNPTAAGSTTLVAANNLNLNTVLTTSQQAIVWNGANFRHDAERTEVGSTIQAKGDIQLAAGNDVSTRAANVSSSGGALQIAAGNNIAITSGESTRSLDEAHQRKSKGLFSSKTTTTRDTLNETQSVASTLSADRIALSAGKDIAVKGSNVVGTNDVALNAQNNVTIEAATDTTQESHLTVEKKSGLFSSGGIGVTLGTRQLSVDNQGTHETASAATVGSNQGNVTIVAGKNFKQVGSSIIAPAGDIDVSAQKIDIVAAQVQAQNSTETKFKQSGLTLALTSPIISAIQTAEQQLKAGSQTKDGRLQALAVANTALAGKNAVQAIQAGQGDANGKVTSTNLDGTQETRDANAADQAGGVNLAISIGGSQSQSKTVQSSSTAQGSTVSAGRDINISATGANKDSDLTIQGSQVNAGRDIKLAADNNINLLAAQSTAEQHSSNKSISASIGISIGTSGIGVTVSASGARGKADGNDVTQSNTQLVAGNQIALASSNDTTLKGAVASAEQVTAKVGGNLNIESLQDTSNFKSKQQSLGVSVTIGAGAGGSISASQSNVNSDFASVTQQSGIRAGDGGFDVQVKGNTDLKGGTITSTQAAIDQDKNRFETAGQLTTSDIQNKADYKASAIGFSAGTSAGTSANSLGGALKPSGNSIGFGKDSGSASSTTQAAISGIAGNKNARTGDKETGIQKIFDADKVQKEIDAQVLITQTFGREAPKAAADFAATQTKPYTDAQLLKASAENQLEVTTDPQQREALLKTIDQTNQTLDANQAQYDLWKEGGAYRVALQTVVGGLGGGLSGALGAGATAAAVPVLNELQGSIVQKLKDAGASDAVANLAGQAVSLSTAAGIGAIAGGGNAAGIASGFNVDANNRQLHLDEVKTLERLQKGKSAAERQRLAEAACSLAHCADGVPDSDPLKADLQAAQTRGQAYTAEKTLLLSTGLFQYSDGTFGRDAINDALLRNDATIQRVAGGVKLVSGSVGAVGGVSLAIGGAAGCAPSVGLSCAAVPAGAALTALSYNEAKDGSEQLFGTYLSQEGQRVLGSFSLKTFPGERDRLNELGIDAATAGVILATNKFGGGLLGKAEEFGGSLLSKAKNVFAKDAVTAEAKAAQEVKALSEGPLKSASGDSGIAANRETIRDGASGVLSAPKSIEYTPSGSVVLQPKGSPLCGPTACNMVINDARGNAIDLNTVVGQFKGVRSSGVNINEMNQVLNNHGITNTTTTTLTVNELNNALKNGQQVIVGVPAGTGNHFIIVDEFKTIDNVPYYLTRDPFVGPRGVRSDILSKAISANGNAIIIGK